MDGYASKFRDRGVSAMLKRLLAFLLILCTLPVIVPAEESAQAIVINEVMASNGMYENEKSYDWIELHNRSKKAVDLSGWMLSDGKKNLAKFVFPKGTKLKAGVGIGIRVRV